jgi:hypothetical protein
LSFDLEKNYLTWGQAWWPPATQEVEIRNIKVPGQLRQKVSKTLSQKIGWAWWFTAVIPAPREVEVGGLPS